MLDVEKFASLNRIFPLTLPSCCRPVCPELHRPVPLAALAVLPGPCQQHLFLSAHFFSTSSFHIILGMMGGKRRTSPPSLFTVSPCIHACFESAINMCSVPDSVAGLSAWGSCSCLKRWCICQATWAVCWGVSGCVLLGSRRWGGAVPPSVSAAAALPPHPRAASPPPGSGFARVARCFQNEITLSHGENKSPQLYRQISLKVFKEDLRGSSLVDDIGNKYEHHYFRFF